MLAALGSFTSCQWIGVENGFAHSWELFCQRADFGSGLELFLAGSEMQAADFGNMRRNLSAQDGGVGQNLHVIEARDQPDIGFAIFWGQTQNGFETAFAVFAFEQFSFV